MEPVLSRDPRTGEVRAQVGVEADTAAVDAAVRAAHATLDALADRAKRSALLRAAADGVESRAAELIAAADAETALGVPRLTGELARVATSSASSPTSSMTARSSAWSSTTPDPSATPPRPELRRWKVPIGTVAVFAASNFPFAFSVPGGDTASALAAGCPVVVKAHPDHPQTSELAAATIRDAAVKVGLPADVLTLIQGYQAGRRPGPPPADRRRRLHRLHPRRARPVRPRRGPAVPDPVLRRARQPQPGARHRAGRGSPRRRRSPPASSRSYTLGQGQFCTKPGLVLVPAGPGGRRADGSADAGGAAAAPGALLDARMREHFLAGFAARAAAPGVRPSRRPPPRRPATRRRPFAPGLLEVDAADLGGDLLEECFGPVTVLVATATRPTRRPCCPAWRQPHRDPARGVRRARRRRLAHPAVPLRGPRRLRRLAHRRGRGPGDDPRRPVPGHHDPHDLGRRHRHRPLAPAGHLPDRPAGAASAGAGQAPLTALAAATELMMIAATP